MTSGINPTELDLESAISDIESIHTNSTDEEGSQENQGRGTNS